MSKFTELISFKFKLTCTVTSYRERSYNILSVQGSYRITFLWSVPKIRCGEQCSVRVNNLSLQASLMLIAFLLIENKLVSRHVFLAL